MVSLKFVSKAGNFDNKRKEDESNQVELFNNQDENNYFNLQENNLLEVDDTLRGLLIKNLYSMDIKDEVIKGILGEGNTSFRPGDILGVLGTLGSGKSLLIMHFIAISILPVEIGGHDQKVYYIDSDSGFSIEVFIERHLIPIIEKKITSEDLRMKNQQNITDEIITKSLNNLNFIFVNDLLDLLCVLRQVINNSSINNYFNNNKAKLLVIDSLNFWNSDSNSFIINHQNEKINNKFHILGYYTNRNTLFNSVFSLIQQIVQYHGFIGLLSFCEEPIIQFTNFNYDKFKNNFTEELVEVENLFQSKKFDQDVNIYYENYISNKINGIQFEIVNKKNEKILLKFPKIIQSKIFPNFLSKIFKLQDFQSITNIIWIAKSSLPICDQIHNYPNSCIIPTYFSCLSINNQQKSYLAFDDFHGFILV